MRGNRRKRGGNESMYVQKGKCVCVYIVNAQGMMRKLEANLFVQIAIL